MEAAAAAVAAAAAAAAAAVVTVAAVGSSSSISARPRRRRSPGRRGSKMKPNAANGEGGVVFVTTVGPRAVANPEPKHKRRMETT